MVASRKLFNKSVESATLLLITIFRSFKYEYSDYSDGTSITHSAVDREESRKRPPLPMTLDAHNSYCAEQFTGLFLSTPTPHWDP